MTIATWLAAACLAQVGAPAAVPRPRATIAPVAVASPVAAGSSLALTLNVTLPEGIHVQSDKPRDPSLIATTVTVTPPPGVTVDRVVFPAAHELVLAGQKDALLVFDSEFSVQAHVTISRQAARGEVTIPVTLRYQACDGHLCFAPTRSTSEWTITITIDRDTEVRGGR